MGGHNNSSNTNTAGDNSTVFGLAAPAALEADPECGKSCAESSTVTATTTAVTASLTDNNTLIGVINGNGNASQQTWGSGNTINNQFNCSAR